MKAVMKNGTTYEFETSQSCPANPDYLNLIGPARQDAGQAGFPKQMRTYHHRYVAQVRRENIREIIE